MTVRGRHPVTVPGLVIAGGCYLQAGDKASASMRQNKNSPNRAVAIPPVSSSALKTVMLDSINPVLILLLPINLAQSRYLDITLFFYG